MNEQFPPSLFEDLLIFVRMLFCDLKDFVVRCCSTSLVTSGLFTSHLVLYFV